MLHSKYKPTGDQPEAIEKLANGFINGAKEQTLLGVTGEGRLDSQSVMGKAPVGVAKLAKKYGKNLVATATQVFRLI